ncbi:MAG: hypothetical protein LBC74_08420 [Planctomycetaceae bacterium]|nr:hypothetical protein [Planctomycetaceae bacterium]
MIRIGDPNFDQVIEKHVTRFDDPQLYASEYFVYTYLRSLLPSESIDEIFDDFTNGRYAMSKQKYFGKIICWLCMIAVISFFDTTPLMSEVFYEKFDFGMSVSADETEHGAFLGQTLKWDKIVVNKTKNAPFSNEYKEGGWYVQVDKVKIEHKYGTNDMFLVKLETTTKNRL